MDAPVGVALAPRFHVRCKRILGLGNCQWPRDEETTLNGMIHHAGRRKPSLCAWLTLLLIGVSGCASHRPTVVEPSGLVGMEMIIPDSGSRYQMRTDQAFLMPEFAGTPALPTYPEALLAQRVPAQRVCVEVHIDKGGAVTASRALIDAAGCASTDAPYVGLFHESVVAATLGWQFLAAAVCTFPEGVEPNQRCDGDGVMVEAVPVRLAFAFVFRIDTDGQHVHMEGM